MGQEYPKNGVEMANIWQEMRDYFINKLYQQMVNNSSRIAQQSATLANFHKLSADSN